MRETSSNPPTRGGHKGNKGALRMDMCVRVRRGLVVAGLLLAGISFGVASGAAFGASAESAATASSIVVEGNRRVEADTIRSYFKLTPGERLDAAKIDAALKALYASGLFQDIRISQSGGRLVVTVVEAPVIDRLAFEGNNKVKDEQLQQEIQSKARSALSRAAVQADVQRILEIYHRSGRFDVKVVPKIISRPNNRVDLVFEINEGEKTGVKSIIFVGNHAYSSFRLKEVIKTSTSNFLSFLQTTDVYDPDRIEADRDLIRRFYLSHGYADVQVVSATGEYDPAQKGFIITFTIEEGPLYHFGKIDIQSNIRAVDPQTLRSALRMRGATFTTVMPSRKRSKMSPSKSPSTDIPSPPCGRAVTATPKLGLSVSSLSSMRACAPISSASISTATPALANMLSGASSISPRETRTIAP